MNITKFVCVFMRTYVCAVESTRAFVVALFTLFRWVVVACDVIYSHSTTSLFCRSIGTATEKIQSIKRTLINCVPARTSKGCGSGH